MAKPSKPKDPPNFLMPKKVPDGESRPNKKMPYFSKKKAAGVPPRRHTSLSIERRRKSKDMNRLRDFQAECQGRYTAKPIRRSHARPDDRRVKS